MKDDILNIASTICKVIGGILLVLALILHIQLVVQMWTNEGFSSRLLRMPSFGEITVWLTMLLFYLPGLGFFVVGQKIEQGMEWFRVCLIAFSMGLFFFLLHRVLGINVLFVMMPLFLASR